ncbi:MAG: Lrp/AsnC family transcriptional regulator [Candidatus Lokiarchaeota archaeon]|nr:Lrp/AsnC family transcriptional regulator [Candidatus Lokiarchaeota archaeon]
MDAIDIQILEELKSDSRKSFNIIAEGVGKTEATVRRRVNKLIEDNVIKKFTIDFSVNTKPKTQATVKIEPDFKEIKNILNELKNIDEITNIWRLSGNCGIFIKVEIESIEKFNPLIEEKLSQIKGCKIIETCFITDIIK